MRRRRTLLLLALLLVVAIAGIIMQQTKVAAARNQMLYFISGPDKAAIMKSPFKYVIIDYSRDGSGAAKFSAADIQQMKRSLPGGRVMISYISVGEAEDYRWYWKSTWRPDPNPPMWQGTPSWLGPENPDWNGCYWVKFSDYRWKNIIYRWIDQIIAQGFDGIAMDVVDVYQNFENSRYNSRPSRKDMEDFVVQISQYAKAKKPGFKIIAHNAEDLLVLPGTSTPNNRYLNSIDGITKEEAFYADGKRTQSDIDWVTRHLNIVKNKGKLVFVIEYPPLNNPTLMQWCASMSEQRGYMYYIGPLGLDRITPQNW